MVVLTKKDKAFIAWTLFIVVADFVLNSRIGDPTYRFAMDWLFIVYLIGIFIGLIYSAVSNYRVSRQ